MILKILAPEIAITSANSVTSNSNLIRVINVGAAAVCNIAYSNAVVYASITVSNTESVVIEKPPTDLISGANMKAAPVAYRY